MEKLQELLPVHPGNGFCRAEDGQSQGMPGPEGLAEKVMDILVGGIFHHGDFLEDDLPLSFDLFRGKTGVQEQVKEKVNGDG